MGDLGQAWCNFLHEFNWYVVHIYWLIWILLIQSEFTIIISTNPDSFITSLLASFATLSKWNVEWLVLTAHSVLSKMDEHEHGNILLFMLVVVRIAAVWYCLVSVTKRLMPFENIASHTLNLTLNLTDMLTKRQREIKAHLLKQPCCFSLLTRLELFYHNLCCAPHCKCTTYTRWATKKVYCNWIHIWLHM